MFLKELLLVLPLLSFAVAQTVDADYCTDNPDFTDIRGKSCSEYDAYDCFEAWRYVNDEDTFVDTAYWNCCECKKPDFWCLPGNSRWVDSEGRNCGWYDNYSKCYESWYYAKPFNGIFRAASWVCCSCMLSRFPYPYERPPIANDSFNKVVE